MVEKSIILAGLGPHARRIYYPLLEKHAQQYNIHLRLVVDLEDQESAIREYLAGRALQPEQLLLADTENRDSQTLNGQILTTLNEVAGRNPIHGLIISTEPKAHKGYALWAIDRDVDVLMDKPVTAPTGLATSLDSAHRVFEDYVEMETRLKHSRTNLIVQCQRRSHQGYRFVKRYLTDFVEQYQIPVSYIDIYHADGMWVMPHELFRRENHPYKYGYGKLMHSGYHFVDLFVWLAEVNNHLAHKKPDQVDLFVKRFGAYDLLHQVNGADYRTLFGTDRFDVAFTPDKLQEARQFGELDIFALCQLKRGDAVVTTSSINLKQNSFCRRAWVDTPEDVYKGNGRVRHERLNVQVANLLNIQVHSYQSYEVNRKDAETEGVGHEDHFDLYIFQNSGVVGGKPLEKLKIGEIAKQEHGQDPTYLGHNENARERNLLDFFQGKRNGLGLETHRLTTKLLSKLYECVIRENHGRIPYTSFAL